MDPLSVSDMGVPCHVKSQLIRDFDVYGDYIEGDDPHLALKTRFSEAPDAFYTTRNGGHWVITGYDLMTRIMSDTEHFSSRSIDIPRCDSPYRLIPLNLDPPEHGPFRRMVMRYFSGTAVSQLEPAIHRWASCLIGAAQPRGMCDFTEELGAGFPVSIFMEMMGLPLSRFAEFRALVTEYFTNIPNTRRIELQALITSELDALLETRRSIRQNDLMSRLLDETVAGRPLTAEELRSVCFLLVIAGLDTVANMLTFGTYHLARRPDIQDRLVRDPTLIPAFVEEVLRRYAVVFGVRLVKKDYDMGDVSFRVGESVMCVLPVAGLDERKNPHANAFDLDRQKRAVLPFSAGAHVCLGHILARAEMRAFFAEWTRRIPRFSLAPGFKPAFRAALVLALPSLKLVWSVPS